MLLFFVILQDKRAVKLAAPGPGIGRAVGRGISTISAPPVGLAAPPMAVGMPAPGAMRPGMVDAGQCYDAVQCVDGERERERERSLAIAISLSSVVWFMDEEGRFAMVYSTAIDRSLQSLH